MLATWNSILVKCGRLLAHPRLWRFLLHPATRYVIAWCIAFGIAGISFYVAWTYYDETTEGYYRNRGHTTIDFGGQYLMGRMLVRGYARHLYDRHYQRMLLREVYPTEDEDPAQERSDVDNLMEWLMDAHEAEMAPADQAADAAATLAAPDPLAGAALVVAERLRSKHVGGPLYPPINAFVYSPLALMTPHWGYRTSQILGIVLAFVAGLAAQRLSEGRIWWPMAAAFIMIFPGYSGSLALGQNAALTLAILMWGWAFIACGRPGWGGFIWGLLAFKPVWAAAFFLVPLLTRRWRVCVTMLATGLALALLTLPAVGLESWRDWLRIGREATEIYKADQNWIELGRDLLTIPRRWFNFDLEKQTTAAEPAPTVPRNWFDFHAVSWQDRHDNPAMALAGWLIWLAAFELTVRVAMLCRDQARAVTGPAAAFLLLGAWMSCFHFMYYDVLLGALPVFLLFTRPRRYLEPILVAIVPLRDTHADDVLRPYYRPRLFLEDSPLVFLPARPRQVWVVNRMVPSLVTVLLATSLVFPEIGLGLRDHIPYDTVCLMALWLWCGWLWLLNKKDGVRGEESEVGEEEATDP
jgi:hypothetical protein